MTALSFIPSSAGAGCGRRLDLAHLASRFAEVDEPIPARRRRGTAGRLAMLALVLVGTIGDTVLVKQQEALARCLSIGRTPSAARIATDS